MIVEPTSVHAISNVGVVSLVLLSVFESPVSLPDCKSGADVGVDGAVVSIVNVVVSGPVTLLAPSVRVTLTVFSHSGRAELGVIL